MTTPRHPEFRGRTAGVVLLFAAGLGLGYAYGPMQDGAAAPHPDDRPAARFGPPRVVPDSPEPAARAAPLDFLNTAAPPNPGGSAAAAKSAPRPDTSTVPADWGKTSAANPAPAVTDPYGPGGPAPAKSGSLIGNAWKDTKGWVGNQVKSVTGGGKPADPPPQPQVGRRPPDAPIAGRTPAGTPVYAGRPAYSWWGWGTTTPGTNPYAPGGEYPQASAGWIAQTGATPGAFPVPVANPFRPTPGAAPPSYAFNPPQPRPMTAPRPPAPAGPVPQPGLRPIARTPPPGTTPPPPAAPQVPTVPPAWRVPTAPGVSAAPAPVSPPAAVPETRWQPAAGTAPVARGQEPPDPLDDRIREACVGLATDVSVTRPGPGRVLVSYTTTTAALAEIVARVVSAVPDAKSLAVDFDATLTAR